MKKALDFSLQNIERPLKLSEQVEFQLRDALNKNVFTQGDKLPSEHELCKIFGVSRNVIREALLILSAKGMIEIRKGKCAIVLEPTISNVLDSFSQLVNFKCGNKGLEHILFVRKIIEPTVALTSALNRSEEDLRQLKKCLDIAEETKDDIVKISQWDIHFHHAIAKSCDNPLIPIVLEPIFHVLSKFHPPIFYDEQVIQITIKYHQRIFAAISAQKSEDAFKAMELHLQMAEKHNLRLYNRQPEITKSLHT